MELKLFRDRPLWVGKGAVRCTSERGSGRVICRYRVSTSHQMNNGWTRTLDSYFFLCTATSSACRWHHFGLLYVGVVSFVVIHIASRRQDLPITYGQMGMKTIHGRLRELIDLVAGKKKAWKDMEKRRGKAGPASQARYGLKTQRGSWEKPWFQEVRLWYAWERMS